MDAPTPGAILPTSATPTGVPLIDIQRHHAPLADELAAAAERVIRSGQFVLGPDCQRLEQSISRLCDGAQAIGCGSGSDALLLALMALDIGPGDDVLVPSYTFFATVSAVVRLGARPIYVDIEPQGYCLDVAQLEAARTPATKAIIPVHLYGQCAEMEAIHDFARRYELTVIEDAAQALGASYQGRQAGSLGAIGCFSFYPTKNLGGLGDSGMLTTTDASLAERLRMLRVHGMEPRYYHQLLGINSRLDSLQAALLNVKLPHLARWTDARREVAARYNELFMACGLDELITLPRELTDRGHVWNQYVIRVPGAQRDALRTFLAESRIGSEIYYPVPMHQQACFRLLAPATSPLPETERAARETLALPMFPELTEGEQAIVVRQIAAFFDTPQPGAHALRGPNFLRTRSVSPHSTPTFG